jgi:hypothetical protein
VVIEHVGVVVPAHNEEILLPRCLDAIEAAVARLTALCLRVNVAVVLDRCTDRSGDIVAARPWVTAVVVDAENVGIARRAGCAHLLRDHDSRTLDRLWLASTDADSCVPVDWLTTQVALANDGAEAVLGTVDVVDWDEHPPHVSGLWRSAYVAGDGHRHVHGANVGCRADAYVAAGGFLALSSDEDVALAGALADRRTVRTGAIPVLTSARRAARLKGGFADYLIKLG